MDEDQYRVVLASLAAHETLIAALLRFAFDTDFTVEQVRQLAQAIKANAQDPRPYMDLAKGDEAKAERLADIVVKMQEEVARIVDASVEAFVVAKRRFP